MLWWLSFWTSLGLCLGSFLNAVIYRLPRHGSLRVPRWSACPNCGHRIAWYDNLPIVSFMWLRGRCRSCALPIATRYVVIEAAMAILVLMFLDAFFIGDSRAGLSRSPFGLTDDLSLDWPMLMAHIVLFACLLSMSAIDLEHYWVDIRFTNFATLAGFAMHTLWTPPHSKAWPRPGDPLAFTAISVVVGLGLVWLILLCWPRHDDEPTLQAPSPSDPPSPDGVPQDGTVNRLNGMVSLEPAVDGSAVDPPAPPLVPLTPAAPSRIFAVLAVLILLALFVSTATATRGVHLLSPLARGLIPLAFFFMLIVRESTVVRESDHEIASAIEEERTSARAMVLKEFGLLLPALLFGVAGLLIMILATDTAARISEILHIKVTSSSLGLFRGWSPLWGFATAASGYVVAGALGWAVRIFFTLLFGKEAFGTGDIHLMAATGCVVGWPVAVLAFFVAVGLAMLGWVIALPFKRPRALPLGPWLSLGFLVVVIFYERIVQLQVIQNLVAIVTMAF